MSKFELKSKVERMRRQGMSLSEICREVPISKSTASLWCQGISLSKKQIVQLEKRTGLRQYQAILRAALTNKRKSEAVKKEESDKAAAFIASLSQREICLIGTALYWAEGHKTGKTFGIVNSDWHVIVAVMRWLQIEFQLEKEDYFPRLFINHLYGKQEKSIRTYWSNITGIPEAQFRNTIFIQSTFKKKFNTHKGYVGVMHLRVRKSSRMLYRALSQIEHMKAGLLKKP